MKKLMMLLVLAPLMALADTWKDPDTGITWTYAIIDGKAQVGTGSSSSSAIPEDTAGAILVEERDVLHQIEQTSNFS